MQSPHRQTTLPILLRSRISTVLRVRVSALEMDVQYHVPEIQQKEAIRGSIENSDYNLENEEKWNIEYLTYVHEARFKILAKKGC